MKANHLACSEQLSRIMQSEVVNDLFVQRRSWQPVARTAHKHLVFDARPLTTYQAGDCGGCSTLGSPTTIRHHATKTVKNCYRVLWISHRISSRTKTLNATSPTRVMIRTLSENHWWLPDFPVGQPLFGGRSSITLTPTLPADCPRNPTGCEVKVGNCKGAFAPPSESLHHEPRTPSPRAVAPK